MIPGFGFRILDFINSKLIDIKKISKTEDRRPKAKFFVIFAFVIFGFFACAERERGRDGIVIADSKSYEASVYRQNCAICHGKEAYGKTTADGVPVPALRFGKAKTKTREEIYQQIKFGKLPMPSFKDQLTETEINKMVDFVMYDLQAREKEKPDNNQK